MAFERERISGAILAAMREVGHPDQAQAEQATDLVLRELGTREASVEEIQDAVERALMSLDLADVARAYIGYRRRRAELRESKRAGGPR